MENKRGKLGLDIPEQTLEASERVKMTPDAVMVWRNRLPMADIGATANQVYHALSDCNKVTLSPKDRFQILELFQTPVQFICQSLRKHYINQTEALTDKKLTITKLAQSLQLSMSKGYKLIVEQLSDHPQDEDYKTLLPKAIERIVHYFNHILLRSYHLYSTPPQDLWREFYILYQFAEQKGFLDKKELLNAFKHVLIMAATDPYKWRQSEQDALFNAGTLWCKEVSIEKDTKNESAGLYLFDFTQDKSPFPPSTGSLTELKNGRILNLTQLVLHLKTLLVIVEPDELHARMQHSNDPEYAISLPVLQGVIQEWENMPVRSAERKKSAHDIEVCIGLASVHYFLSGEKTFQPQQDATSSTSNVLPSLSIQEDTIILETPKMDVTDLSNKDIPSLETSKKTTGYSIYEATEIDESNEGSCLIWKNNVYPPIQAGELIGLFTSKIGNEGKRNLQVAMVRWLKHPNETELRIGIRKLSESGIAAAAQIVKEGRGAGYYLRCLILDTGILTPILPFKPGSQVLVLRNDTMVPEEIELIKLRSSTGNYKLFDYRSKEKTEVPLKTLSSGVDTEIKLEEKPKPKGDEPFDSIWSNL